MSHHREVSLLALGPLALALFVAAPAHALEVRGVIAFPPEAVRVPTLGYTRTRVAAPSALFRSPVADAAVFLRVKESLPLPPPSAKWAVRFAGLRITPGVIACAIDESLVITNDERSPVTVVVGTETLQPIAPGASLTYLCQQAGWQKIRAVEWPHVRAELFVGEVGVVALPGPDGKFSMTVPQGTYALEVVTVDGGRLEVPVTVAGRDVDVGRLEPGMKAPEGDAPPPAAEESPSPSPRASATPSATPSPTAAAPVRTPAATPSPSSTPKPKPKPVSPPGGGDEIQLEP